MENLLWDLFMAIWAVLNLLFRFIDDSFANIFNAIPQTAIPFVVGIFCYSIVAIFLILLEKLEGSERLAINIFYKVFLIVIILFTIWRFGFIALLDDRVNADTLSQFFINMIYIMFAFVLFISFYRSVPWLKKAIIVLLWSCLTLLTFLICPLVGESETTTNTILQFLVIMFVFVIPHSVYYKVQSNERGEE